MNTLKMGEDNSFDTEQSILLDSLESDRDGFVSLSEICFKFLNEQTQYVSRHLLTGFDEPYLADELRISGDDEYDLMIHRDDLRTFISRLREHRAETGQNCR